MNVREKIKEQFPSVKNIDVKTMASTNGFKTIIGVRVFNEKVIASKQDSSYKKSILKTMHAVRAQLLKLKEQKKQRRKHHKKLGSNLDINQFAANL